MVLRLSLDRDLPVSIGVQIKGQIEYGIVTGQLRPGEQLLSVRDLAAHLEVAPVTVSNVYADLKREGLIQVRPGLGTYVAVQGDSAASVEEWSDLHRLADTMIEQARARGFSPAEINRVVAARLAIGGARRPRLAMVGLFDRATQVYARDIAEALTDLGPEVAVCTLQELRAGVKDAYVRVCAANLVLTLANQVREVQQLLGAVHPPVQGLSFVVHPATVAQLGMLSSTVRLGLVSTFADFLPTMLQGVTAWACSTHVPLCTALSDAAHLAVVLAESDVVVYSSGSEEVLARLPPGIHAIEYLHTPEVLSVEALRPLLARINGTSPSTTNAGREGQTAGMGAVAPG